MRDSNTSTQYADRRHHRSAVGGAVLIVIGALFLANNYLPDFDFSNTWPLILVAVGAAMIFNGARREGKGETHENQ